MISKPYTFELKLPRFLPSHYDNHVERRLSSMDGQFLDQQAFLEMSTEESLLLYEVYELKRPETAGELLHGVSIVHPGKVGNEFFMTKGHFHTVIDTAEVYYCLQGKGYMVMETPEGEWSAESLQPGSVLYVPPRWAHRSVNVLPDSDLITFFVYPGNAGHDYGTIENQGFRKLVVDSETGPVIIDNPRWKSPEERNA
ncbi:MAG: glucose-6-phosphate isomerase family protein [Anaerolineaceae bacterium]